jgi:AraC-like DNA-binding protein/ligand-binding sensor protein
MSDRLNVFLRDEVQKLIDALAHSFRVKITLFSANMEELRVGLQNPGSPFCHLVQQPLKRLHQCRAMDRQMCHRAQALGQTAPYRCHAGLVEAVLPISLEGITVGFLMVGQFRETVEPSAEVAAQWAATGASPEVVRDAFFAVPYLDPVTRDNMLTLASVLAQFLVNQEFVSLNRGPLMDGLSAWVQEHLTEPIRIDDAADALGKGASTLAHTVKAKTGMSFTQYLSRRRIERFEALARQRPGMNVQEGALAVGFADPLYFSRTYKQIRGTSPSAFLAAVREGREPVTRS